MKEFVEWSFVLIVFAVVVGGIFAAWWESFGSEWVELGKLIKLAKTYGIEYIPGENVANLRARIVKRRDKLLGDD